MTRTAPAALLLLVVVGEVAGDGELRAPLAAPTCGFVVAASYPHDPDAFTQGLVIDSGTLYEGTGLEGESSLREVDMQTGVPVRQLDLDPNEFGEGITVWGDEIVQLTWQDHIGYVYDIASFTPVGSFSYPTEGWGLTHDVTNLIMSDGTSVLRFLDPVSYVEVSQLAVRDGTQPVTNLNELEYIHGEIYANVWYSDLVARIDPVTGQVIAWVDLAGLLSPPDPGANVLNGIAHDAATDRMYFTGKLWPTLYRIKLVGADCPGGMLYGDGFESGDMTFWSASAP